MDETTELFNAIGAGDAQRVRDAISRTPGLSRSQNEDRLSVLQWARFCGKGDVLALLVAAGPPLDVFDAASIDDEARLRELLAGDRSLASAFSEAGFTALHFASYYGAARAVRLLLDAGASTEAVTRNFLANMPLHAAAAGHHTAICETLLEHGADVNAKQHGGFVPLHTAAQHGDPEMVRLFLRYGADPRLASDEGKTGEQLAQSQGHSLVAALLRYEASKS
jgi:ankyrin repeat protein